MIFESGSVKLRCAFGFGVALPAAPPRARSDVIVVAAVCGPPFGPLPRRLPGLERVCLMFGN
jgi:hypothetical protein